MILARLLFGRWLILQILLFNWDWEVSWRLFINCDWRLGVAIWIAWLRKNSSQAASVEDSLSDNSNHLSKSTTFSFNSSSLYSPGWKPGSGIELKLVLKILLLLLLVLPAFQCLLPRFLRLLIAFQCLLPSYRSLLPAFLRMLPGKWSLLPAFLLAFARVIRTPIELIHYCLEEHIFSYRTVTISQHRNLITHDESFVIVAWQRLLVYSNCVKPVVSWSCSTVQQTHHLAAQKSSFVQLVGHTARAPFVTPFADCLAGPEQEFPIHPSFPACRKNLNYLNA